MKHIKFFVFCGCVYMTGAYKHYPVVAAMLLVLYWAELYKDLKK